jgi:predicted HNH restriction endonuclease
MANAGRERRDYLTLWKWTEALAVEGTQPTGARGAHSTSLGKGDRAFIWATNDGGLYLLGALEILSRRNDRVNVRSIFGDFRIIPLNKLQSRLRFLSESAPALTSKSPLAMQVRSRRKPTPETVRLLLDLLRKETGKATSTIRAIEKHPSFQEGRLRQKEYWQRERNPLLRAQALYKHGYKCQICDFDFEKVYGDFAKYCVEVHHLNPLASSRARGRTSTSDDVIVLCPNCHRALHKHDDPCDWRAIRTLVSRRRKKS